MEINNDGITSHVEYWKEVFLNKYDSIDESLREKYLLIEKNEFLMKLLSAYKINRINNIKNVIQNHRSHILLDEEELTILMKTYEVANNDILLTFLIEDMVNVGMQVSEENSEDFFDIVLPIV